MADGTGLLDDIKFLNSLGSGSPTEASRQAAEKELAGLDMYQVAANSKEQRDPKYVGEIEGLLRSNDFEGLRARLGDERATQVQDAYNEAWRKVEQDRNVSRSAGQTALDTAVGIGGTVINGVNDAEAMVMGSPVGQFLLDFGGIGENSPYGINWDNNQYAAVVADQNKQVNDQLINPLYSSTVKNQRKLVGLQDAQDERDHALQAQDAAEAARGDFLPTLGAWTGRVIKDAGSGAVNTLSNPTTAAQGTTDAVGSMILAGGVTEGAGQVLKVFGERALKNRAATILEKQLAKGVERTAAEELAAEGVKALEKRFGQASAAAGVAATEGASAYQQQAEQVLNTSLDDLTKNSPALNAEVSRLQGLGVPFEEAEVMARRTIANQSAQDAAGKTAIVSAGIGALLPEGAESPTHVKSAGNVASAFAKDAVKEGVEETLQGGSGQLIQNAAQQKYVDSGQDILSGVGTQAGAGGVLGIASSGLLKAPSTAAESVGLGVDKTRKVVAQRAEAKLAQVEAQSPSSLQGLVKRSNDLLSGEDNLRTITRAAKAVTGGDMEADTRLQDRLTSLLNAPAVDSLPGSVSTLGKEAQSKFSTQQSRAEAVSQAARMLLAEKNPGEAAKYAQVFSDLMEPVRQFQETPAELDRLSGDKEASGVIKQYQGVLADIAALPEVKKAQARALEVLDTKSPQGLAAMAAVDPGLGGRVKSAEVEGVLAHAQAGSLTDAQQAALRGSLALLKAREALESSRDPRAAQGLLERHLAGDRNVETTGRQATVELNPAHTEDGKYSARQHVDRVIRSMMSGNVDQARAYLKEFGNFAQHYQNKVGALNESVRRGGERVSYQQYIGNDKFVDSRENPKNYKHKDTWVNLKSQASVKTATEIDVEANLLGNLYDGLRQAYPELGAGEIQRQNLDLEAKPEQAKAQDRRVEQRPVQPAEKVAPEPRNDRPTSKAIENLRSRLQEMTLRDRARLVGTDYVTGLRTRASWEESPRSGKQVMVLTSTAVKPINDHPDGGHDVTNDVLRVMGMAVGKIDPNAARSGTNFLLETDLSPQEVMDQVRSAMPDPDIELSAGVGPDLESAFQDEKATTTRLREEGKLPQRGETKFDLGKLKDMKLPEGKAKESLSQQTVDRVRKLSNEDYQSKVLEDSAVPGVLSGVGWRLIPRKAFVASIDLKGLKRLNDTIGAAFGDSYLEAFSHAGLEMGGAEFDFAHLSGDEYAVQADSEKELWDWLHKLEKHLEENVKLRAVVNGEEVLITPAMRREVGTSYGDADKRLNTAKRAELAAAAQAQQQQAAQADVNGRAGGADGERAGNQGRDEGATLQGATGDAGRGEVGAGGGVQEDAGVQQQEVARPKTTAERFPNLFQIPGKVRNFFAQSLRFRPDSTRTSGVDHPVDAVYNAINTQNGIREFMGRDPRGTVTPEVAEAYKGYLRVAARNVAEALHGNLQAFLKTPYSKGDPRTMEELLRSGEKELTIMQRGKVLNLLELTKSGNFAYNSHLMEGAIMAALQWQLSSNQRSPESRPDEIAQELGYQVAEDVPSELISLMKMGQSTAQAKQSLASYIRRFWGVKPDPKSPMGFGEAIPEAMAAELLRAMVQAKLLTVTEVDLKKYPQLDSEKDFHRYVTVDSKSALNHYPELLEEMVVKEPEFATHYGDDVPPVADRQLSNSEVKLSEQTKAALSNMQAQKFYLNMPLVEGVTKLTEEAVIALFGNTLPKDAESKYNKAHLDSLVSQNKSLLGAFKELNRLVGEMRNRAGDGDVGQLAKKYQYAVNSVNRIMMLGAHNPQASKLMREMILPTWSTLNMGDESGENYRYFMQAFSQAMGQKVHQKSLEENVQWARGAIGGELAPVISVLSSWLQTKEAFPVKAYREALSKTGVENSYLVAMALTEVARLQNASQEEKAKFRTPLYLESDGMTNGPFNSMGLLAVGEVTESDIQNWKRGGLSVGAEPKTADRLRKVTNKTDLYKEGMNEAQVEVNHQLQKIRQQKDGKPILTVASAMFTAMQHLLGGEVSWDVDKLEAQFERGLGKNPSTVLVYGAGNPGIANKLVSRITTAFYEKLSAVARVGGTWEDAALEMFPEEEPAKALYMAQQLKKSMDWLAGTKVVKNPKTGQFFLAERGDVSVSSRVAKNPQKFEFTKEELKRMQTNMLFLLVNPMKEGIKRVLGPSVFTSGDLLVRATQLQSTVAREIYIRAINQKLEEKTKQRAEENGGDLKAAKSEVASEFLSRQELEKIWGDLRDVMPLVEADGQNFLIAKNSLLSAGGKGTNMYSRALDDTIRTEPYVSGIAPAGVAARPYLTIGMGDARMVRKVFEGGLDGSMQVFDGINIPVDRIGEYGSKINQAALQAWQGNIFSSVRDTFRKFSEHPRVKELLASEELNQKVLEETVNQRLADIQEERTTKMTPKQVEEVRAELMKEAKRGSPSLANEMKEVMVGLEAHTKLQDARNTALAKFAMSMDQMAGTYRPHVSQGIDVGNLTDSEVRDAINQEIRKALDVKPMESPKSVEVIHRSGASVYSGQTMPQFLKWLQGKVTREEAQVLREVFKSGNLKNTRVVVGTTEQVQAFQRAEGLSDSLSETMSKKSGQQLQGYYHPGEDVVYLMGSSVETAVHELIHAGTFKQVLAHYQGKDTSQSEAIQHLERLMETFLDLDVTLEGEAGAALESARAEIYPYMARKGAVARASALNEFMAWTLANRSLAQELGKSDGVFSRLTRLVRAAYNIAKKLMGKDVPDDFASQVRFSTAAIARVKTVESMVNDVTLAHATLAGIESNRLTELSKSFGEKIARYLSSNPREAAGKLPESMDLAKDTASRAQAAFGLGSQAADTFQMMVMAFATEASLDPQAMTQAQELYSHFLSDLTQDDFMTGLGDEQSDRQQAKEKFDFISGHTQSSKSDPSGRSTLLPSFLALAAVDDGFRALLNKKGVPGKSSPSEVGKKLAALKLDSALEVAGQVVMDKLQDRLTGTDHPENVRVAIDQLTQSIIKSTEESRMTLAEKLAPTGVLHTWNDKVAEMLEQAGQRAGKVGSKLGRSESPVVRGAATVLKAVSILTSEQDAAVAGEEVLRQMDKHPAINQFFKDVVADMIGRTSSQAKVYDLIKRVRALVSQTRQAYRENLPETIRQQFKTQPTDAQWNTLHKVMGRFDMASLLDGRSVSDVLELASDPEALGQEVSQIEAKLGGDAQGRRYLEKVNQYVNYVLTGERGTNLLRNAHAISELLGEERGEDFNHPDSGVVKDIDELITLRLLSSMDGEDRTQFNKLVSEEPRGMEFTLSYLKGQRKTEMERATQGMAKYNYYKGMMPVELQGRGHVVVVDDAKYSRMVEMGYTRMGTYSGSSIENTGASKSYWYSPEGGVKTTFNQGIAQNVQGTAYGVRTESGTSLENHAGIINDPVAVRQLAKRMHREAPGPETLSPVYDQDGVLVAFERSLDPKQTSVLYGDQHLAKMIGEWRGRQVEEAWAGKINQELLNHLHEMWENDEHKDRYVNLLGDDLDPVVRDAVNIMPRELKSYAEEKFGKGQFMVRRNLVNNVAGYRSASVGDLWTGTSRWSPETQEALRKALIAVPGLGLDAYRKLVWAERNWQAVVGAVKTNIVVRSMVVPLANFMSGIMQLNVRGVPVLKALRTVPAKTAELEFYSKTMARKIALEAERFANENDVTKVRRIDAQVTALEDSLKRLSIWPLIEAGEFSTITDVGQTVEDLNREGDNMVEKLSNMVDELPPGLRDLARQGLMTRDTALFRAMQKATQYSDFIMKSIYFDVLRSEGQSKESALANITEEYNNYDVLPGRDRGYAESVGMAWFLNYKIRATKIGLSMIRKNPLNMLMYLATPHPSSIGIPGTDNLARSFIESLMELSLGRAFGPGMATNPIALNPWYNLVSN